MTPSDKISPTVFVVADDQQLLDSLEILLDVLGFAVRSFTNLAHFLSFYRPQMPGCLLFDLHMSGARIQDVYAQVKERGLRLATIVIAEQRRPNHRVRSGGCARREHLGSPVGTRRTH